MDLGHQGRKHICMIEYAFRESCDTWGRIDDCNLVAVWIPRAKPDRTTGAHRRTGKPSTLDPKYAQMRRLTSRFEKGEESHNVLWRVRHEVGQSAELRYAMHMVPAQEMSICACCMT